MRSQGFFKVLMGFAIACTLLIAPVRFVVVNAVVNTPEHQKQQSAAKPLYTDGVYDGVLMKMSDLSYANLDNYTHRPLEKLADLSATHKGPSGIFKQVQYVDSHDWHVSYSAANNTYFSDLTGWSIYKTMNRESVNGFYAVAFKKGNTVVIAYRGTNNVDDLVSDAGIYLNVPDFIDQLPNAEHFVSTVRKTLPSGNYHVIFTGHSLGAWLAQQMYLDNVGKYKSWNVAGATVFDSIGTHFDPNLSGIAAVKDYRLKGDLFSHYGTSLGKEIDVKNPAPNASIYGKHQMHDFYQYFYPNAMADRTVPL